MRERLEQRVGKHYSKIEEAASPAREEEPSMIMPGFFQNETEKGLMAKANWLQEQFGLDDVFFSNLLSVQPQLFSAWKAGNAGLAAEKLETLAEFWTAIAHILSLLNYQVENIRRMLSHKSAARGVGSRHPFGPPWVGKSLTEFLQTEGRDGVRRVNSWIQLVRFGEPTTP
jgi:hypothetical protein